MRVPNFICPITNELFYVESWKAKLNSKTKQIEYFQTGPGWKVLTNPKNGAALIKSDEAQIHMTSVKTETASR